MEKKKKTVLLVEDDGFISEIYNVKLELKGFEVDLAEDGEEAVEKFKKTKPDIVLLDIFLPKKDGWEVLEEIHKEDHFEKTKVIMLTNLGDKDKIEKAENYGIKDYFVKASHTPEEVVQKIKDVL
ncbi:MAG: response regulator [Patescibacteria group bacterium]